MNHKTIFYFLLLISSYCNAQLKYPVAPRMEVTDTIFKTVIEDPFRAFEDNSEEVSRWLSEQAAITNLYKNNELSFYNDIRDKLEKYSYYTSNYFIRKGKYYYRYFYNDDRYNASLYLARDPEGAYTKIVDPRWFEKRGQNLDISNFSVSKNDKYLMVALSNMGSDWSELRIQNLASGKFFDDVITDVYDPEEIVWKGNGFYYWKYSAKSALTTFDYSFSNRKLYYHLVNTNQESDVLLDAGMAHALINSYQITPDEQYMVLETKSINHDVKNSVWIVKSINQSNGQQTFFSAHDSLNYTFKIIGQTSEKIYFLTNQSAVSKKIVAYDVATDSLTTVVKEYSDVLETAQLINEKLICLYYRNGAYGVVVYDLEGKEVMAKTFPVGQSVKLLEMENFDKNPAFIATAFSAPLVTFEINIEKLRFESIGATTINYDNSQFITKYVNYPSKDGTMIPMFITYRKGIEIGSGDNPVLIYGYGGYGISTTPFYDEGHITFMEAGGVLAVPQIRGGGEFGDQWHNAGARLKKQNTFDDFIAAAEYLIKIRLTNSDKIAINGASHGGMVVGVCMTQRPELFKAAIPEVGVFDMIRSDLKAYSGLNFREYGTIHNEKDFKNIYSYSPLHNLNDSIKYPATLLMTADSDERVPPWHSYKFSASLQQISTSSQPYLLYVAKKTGHSGPSSRNDRLDYEAMKYSFIFKQLGMQPKR